MPQPPPCPELPLPPLQSLLMLLITFVDALICETTLLIPFLFLNKFIEIHVRNVEIAPDDVHVIPRHANFLVASLESFGILVVIVRHASQDASLVLDASRIDHDEQIDACLLVIVYLFEVQAIRFYIFEVCTSPSILWEAI